MIRIFLHWLVSALAVWITAQVVPGFQLDSVGAAILAAIVIGLVNATLGIFLKVVTFPLTVLTLGLFWFVLNAILIEVASVVVPGFHIRSFASAFWGGIVLSLVNVFLKWLIFPSKVQS